MSQIQKSLSLDPQRYRAKRPKRPLGGGTESSSEITTPSDNSESNHIPQEGGEEGSEEGSDQEGSDGEEGSLTPDSSEIPAEGSGEGAQEEGEGSHEGGSQESTEEGTETGAEDGEGSEEGTNGDKPAASEEGSGAGETPAEGTEEEPGSEEGAGSEGEETGKDDAEESQGTGTGASQEGGASGGSSSGGTQADTPINGGSADNTLKEDDNAQEEIKEQESEDEEAASESEPVSYIIEEISFTDAEIRASKAQRESLQYKSALEEGEGSFGIGRFGLKPKAANAMAPLSLDTEKKAEGTEAHVPEKEEDTAGYMIERHIDVDDGIEDIKLPDKLVIKLRAAEGEEDHTASKSSATASKSNAHETAETKAAGKVKTLTVEIPEESWLIMSPEDKAGAPIAELDTSGVELLDENGEPTGEFSTEQANYPQYILVPDIDNIDIEGSLSEEGSETGFIDMDQMLTKSNTATLEDYLLKNTAVMLRVGEDIEYTSPFTINLDEGEKAIPPEVGSVNNNILSLKQDGWEYILIGELQSNISIEFADNVKNATIILKNVTIASNRNNTIDFDGVENAVLKLEGTNSLSSSKVGINVPQGTNLTISVNNPEVGGSVAVSGNMGAIGVTSGINGDITIESGTIEATSQAGTGISCVAGSTLNIRGGNVTASAGVSNAGIGAGTADVGTINISGGIVTAKDGSSGIAIGSAYGSGSNGTLNISGSAKVILSGMAGGNGTIGKLDVNIKNGLIK